ncbi:hypothetical protein [Herminiimonas fonticola]|uniref:Uncharacterized protein n=1 Tax=Herminiimonas fonticola TaxID=303380 RepID=A0A4R6G5W2_9BURK|nr:hypothetical protein [Herminiimonas fonticola]RBA23830.1 hypothetical protein Hfont_1642 [Herminiimonas fonticola]TDN89832.1 hypothetical protein EV677_1896 [Herminiimonas fonticola]
MMTQVDAVKQRNAELKDRAERETIVHETVPGEDRIQSEQTKKDKASVSTTDEDTN